jgi:hypothetical protein
MTQKDLGFAPNTMKEGTRFIIPSLCTADENPCDKGGRAMSFQSSDDQKAMRDYYDGLCNRSAALCSWVYEKDNLVVQINGDLPEDTAEQYDRALQAVGVA